MFKVRKKSTSILILFIWIFIILKLYKTFTEYTHSDEQNKGYIGAQKNEKRVIKEPIKAVQTNYIILEYTKIFGASKFCENKLDKNMMEQYKDDKRFMKTFSNENKKTTNRRYNLLDNCEYKNCFFTCDKSQVSTANALLFHDYDLMNEWPFFPFYYWNLFKQRLTNQLWIYWNDEPKTVESSIDKFNFNWTMSYNLQSDISKCAYGCLKNSERNDHQNFIKEIKIEFSKRINSALWFVSNCGSTLRLQYALKLSKLFNVKIHGSCDTYFQNKQNFLYKIWNFFFDKEYSCPRESKCEMDYLANNKFYLAFESTNCSDYITEKFWRTLSYGLIPIVFQPSRQSYERVAPPNSFIHAQDFNFNAKLLAQYLVNVSSDFDLYFKHVEWRFKYDALYKINDLEGIRMCELCEKLNEGSSIDKYYKSVSAWFNQKCVR
jgi:glycoprotein 3-alpha-L-fucosyltransferase